MARRVAFTTLDSMQSSAIAKDPSAASDAAPVLAVRGVAKSYGRGIWPVRKRTVVLRDACLEVRPGELVGLVGENGSGKSTLMQIIVGLIGRDAGEVQQAGQIGYCPQYPMLWDKLTVDEHFALFATGYGMSSAAASVSADALLEELAFTKYRGYRVEALSGGTRQKLNLALALMHDPALLLLDEPYSGFDWETYQRFWEMAAKRRDAGMAILVVSHLLAERERLDRMVELRSGEVCGC